MKIAILSRAGHLYSTQSLYRAATRRQHEVEIIDFMHCQLILGSDSGILWNGIPLEKMDGIVPRIGSSVTSHGAAVIRQFELMGVQTTASADALLRARNKLLASQMLAAGGLQVPRTIYSGFTYHTQTLIEAIGGMPVVIKLLQGTHGMGVMLLRDERTAMSVIEAMYSAKQKFLVQEYIAESSGTDIRAIVVGGEVICAMRRKAEPGEFRANLHRGAQAVKIQLNESQTKAAIQAADIMGLDVAGVDMLMSKKGPLILEVNASPGLEGIETATKVDVAGAIIDRLLWKHAMSRNE